MNELPIGLQARVWPEEIIVEPARLSIGLWGESKGDIAAAYCADTLPKCKTFLHDGQLFTNTGGSSGNGRAWVDGYPLIPENDYRGPEPRRYSYEGEPARYKGRNYRLGRKVMFICRERTMEEWADLLRRQYAYGGGFASGKTYAEMLESFAESGLVSAGERVAIEAESNRADLPKTQEAMRLSFARHVQQRPASQLELILGI